jgi:uracil-DNA glycosylase
MVTIGNDWDDLLKDEWKKPYYQNLREFLREEYSSGTVYPPAGDIFNALKLTPYSEVKAVILGQDPYHEPGQAQGLAFSVPYEVPQPPSLVNIIKELDSDPWRLPEHAGHSSAAPDPHMAAGHGSAPDSPGAVRGNMEAAIGQFTHRHISGVLVPWTRQGVLLLNTSLTVRAHQAGSHRGKGWEQFTDRVIELLAGREKPMVFILWGSHAGAKRDLILNAQGADRRHLIIQAPHPSPLSAYRGFFGGRYFSRCNYFLEDNGIEPIDWSL